MRITRDKQFMKIERVDLMTRSVSLLSQTDFQLNLKFKCFEKCGNESFERTKKKQRNEPSPFVTIQMSISE